VNYLPYQSNGLEVSLISKLRPFKLSCSMQTLNNLSKTNHFKSVSLSYKQAPHKLNFKYSKNSTLYHDLEMSYLINPKINVVQNLDMGFSFTLNEKNSFDLNYYEFFIRAVEKKYQFLGALTSNRNAKGVKKLSPGNLTLALRKKSFDTIINLILEHNLHDKRSVLTAIYESNIENAIILKNFVIK